ncbi:MAG: hypothetical protein HYR62_01915 [Actinobacteria bacterium]|nr:hypothetical protein [Actinomycetota bacterium]MBI3687239.1 hypothetical protein [Actinomycetota bacterium]
MTTRADRRLWRTATGGLVNDGHPDARHLAYAAGDELPEADALLVTDAEVGEAIHRPADKARRRTTSKASTGPAGST